MTRLQMPPLERPAAGLGELRRAYYQRVRRAGARLPAAGLEEDLVWAAIVARGLGWRIGRGR